MNKITYFSGFLALVLISSVIAAGSSASDKIENNFKIDKKLEETNKKSDNEKRKMREKCEEYENRKERIKCRLDYIKENKENFEALYNKIPESCRNLDFENRGKCVSFYQKSQACYEKNGIEKNKCFKRIANFAKANLKDEKEGKNQKARDYVILLLYDIQEKVEEAIKNQKIDAEKGSDIINKITEIKEDILSGKTKNEIKPKFAELKELLKKLKSSIDKKNE
jgi:hypothetical protein